MAVAGERFLHHSGGHAPDRRIIKRYKQIRGPQAGLGSRRSRAAPRRSRNASGSVGDALHAQATGIEGAAPRHSSRSAPGSCGCGRSPGTPGSGGGTRPPIMPSGSVLPPNPALPKVVHHGPRLTPQRAQSEALQAAGASGPWLSARRADGALRPAVLWQSESSGSNRRCWPAAPVSITRRAVHLPRRRAASGWRW
jgi:hypothetical protein